MTTSPLALQTIAEAFDAVAAKQPAPGGGAVAALVGALAGALGRMVAAYSAGKKDLAIAHAQIEAIGQRLAASQQRLLELADEDAEAYTHLTQLTRLPDDAPERTGLADATRRAAGVPLEIVQESARVLDLAEELAPKANTWLRSDLAITAILAEAAARSAAWMVTVNLPGLNEHAGAQAAGETSSACLAALEGTPKRLDRVLQICGESS